MTTKTFFHDLPGVLQHRGALLLTALLALSAVVCGIWYYRHYERRYCIEVERQLSSIAELKADELAEWRNGRLADASIFYRNAAFAALTRRFLADPGDTHARQQLRQWIGKCQTAYQYSSVILMDTQGVIRLSAPLLLPSHARCFVRDAAATLGARQITFLDFHRNNPDDPIHLGVLVPLFDEQAERRPLALLALTIDPHRYLYPYLKHWPLPSRTAESQLIRRDGNAAMFLNELRFMTNTALALRIALTNTAVAAVKAVRGQTGIVTGTDYRHVAVIADLRAVPDSPWFLVTKMDRAELYAPLRQERLLISLVIVVLLISLGTGVALIWQQNAKEHYRQLLAAEQARRESEHLHRSIRQAATDGFWLANRQGRLLEVNEAYCRMSGYRAQELLAMNIADLEVIETPADSAAHAQKIISQGTDRFETRHRRKDGSVFDVEVNVQYQPGHGGIFVAFLHDITARTQAAEQIRTLLAESNRSRVALLGILEDETKVKADLKRLATAIEQAAEIVVITDAQGQIQYVNPAFEATTGYTRAEAMGQNPRVLKSGRHDALFYRSLWETIRGGQTWHGRFINRKKNGVLYTEDAAISPVLDAAGQIVNFVAVKRDITAQLNLEAQLSRAQKLESAGQLAGGVAHDFNNILQTILGNTELALEQTDPAAPLYADLKEIQSASRRAGDLTRQLLAFASKQTITPRILNLNDAVEGMLKMLRRLIAENIELVWAPRTGLWPIQMDPSQIDQIMANLCVNARDAIAGVGAVHIATENAHVDELKAAQRDGFRPGDYVLLTVSDTGCGMDKETLGKIFEPFYTTKATGKGTGLGLATVYGIIRQNKGYISVYSEPGKGSTFRIHLPRYLGAAVAPLDEPPALPAARGCETVLLVEDDATILNMSGRMLRELGYTVLAAGAPEAALHMAADHRGEIQILVTDVIMPGINGRELADQLQARHPSLKCLFMSGYTASVISHHGVLEPGCHFIAKPFSRDELARKIREVLENK